MAKENFRYINTRFWDDNYIVNLDPSEKLLYLYLLTNPLTNLSGIYEISFKRIAFDTGFDKEMIEKILKRFTKGEKIFYIDGYIFIKNFTKNQRYRGEKLDVAIKKERENIPNKILSKISKFDTPSIPYDKDKDKDKEKEENKQIGEIIKTFRDMGSIIKYENKTERSAAETLIQEKGFDVIKRAIEFYRKNQNDKFIPTITKPSELLRKYGQLIAFKNKKI